MNKVNKKLIAAISIASLALAIFGLTRIVSAWVVYANPAVVTLGTTASTFAVLAGAAVNDTTPSTVIGDVGLSPTTGAAIAIPSTEVTGTIYSVDGAGAGDMTNPGLLTTAKSELSAAYNNANLRAPNALVGDLSDQTLGPGIYGDNNAPDSMEISAAGTKILTLDGGGNPDAVFIFQSDTTLTTSAGSEVKLINGAQACNVFWQVGSSVHLGVGSTFVGTIMAAVSITDDGDSIVTGRLMADADNTDADSTGAVTLNNTHLTKSVCSVAPAPTPPTQSPNTDNTLTVIKQVINDNDGTAKFSDFPLFVSGNPVDSGESVRLVEGIYTVTETNLPNYATTFAGDCDANGKVNHGGINTHNSVCFVINDDIGAPVVVPPVPPLIDVVKVPSPLSLPDGPGSVTYTYTLRNIGTVPVTDITMIGDTCSSIILTSGDTNKDSKLDVNETWKYNCSTTLSETHTNTVVATGWANGLTAIDYASATVVVGVPIVPPLIHVVKKPSVFTLPAGGGAVTYTYTVTNPGTEPLSDVSITDDKCTGLPGRVIGHPGDLNKNNLLESNEAWSFTCKTNLTKTTTNIGTAEGSANGLSVRDFSTANVVVASAVAPKTPAAVIPKLPKTGLSVGEENTPWNIAITFGILALVAGSLFAVIKKRTI